MIYIALSGSRRMMMMPMKGPTHIFIESFPLLLIGGPFILRKISQPTK
jgi:hypothetical protein